MNDLGAWLRLGQFQSADQTRPNATDFEDVFSSGRQWYGRVRGADQIFSFHPFALESIADNGASLPVRMRRELTDAGIIAPFDGRVHTAARYVRSQEE